jgi:predicted TIM-barrel fold metal-dependent hydrolase
MKICFEEWGFVQLGEMEQYSHHFKMNDSNTEKVVRLAAEYDVPVQVHCGTWWCKGSKPGGASDGLNQMGELIDIAERVPQAKFILAHAIGDDPPTPNCVSLANMYLDILKGVFPSFPQNFWVEICNFQTPALQRTLKEIPVTRLICGTDWTTRIGPPFQSYGTMFGYNENNNPFPPKVSSFTEFLRKAGASNEDIKRIGCENARELLKLRI